MIPKMVSKTELRLLKGFFSDLTKGYSIRQLSRDARFPYPQVHRAVQALLEKKLLKKEQKGRSWELTINWQGPLDELMVVEIERKRDLLEKYPLLAILQNDLESLRTFPLLCILFGSYAQGKAKKTSDIDLLFVIPEEYDYEKFEKMVKNALTQSHVDLQITTEKGLAEMWQHPLQLNVGNEILKKHVVLWGGEAFFQLRKRHYWGSHA